MTASFHYCLLFACDPVCVCSRSFLRFRPRRASQSCCPTGQTQKSKGWCALLLAASCAAIAFSCAVSDLCGGLFCWRSLASVLWCPASLSLQLVMLYRTHKCNQTRTHTRTHTVVDDFGSCAIHAAATADQTDAVKLLLQSGADPNAGVCGE